ncbi:hypothetical protein BU23DRAFT_575823 [Bimuria novae-zelandiae CBS 107.79]|uniref:BTB domain-containing protein n=1 Tax=Bimuria novae-zelandiae CBS 107.79 TaxID=1447943 RepID=A0A6A5UJV0_9PLEO|nr:hypothetical protein BU23DRAFT_575823 [Bimuria novae-zelandiae CBS 107.79]
MTEQKGLFAAVDQDGDVELLVQDRRFLVRSSKMSAISPAFQKLFSRPLTRIIKLPGEDPEAFYRICQSAHGFLVRQADISTDTLVKMANAIARYKIRLGSNVHYTLFSSFVVQALRPEAIPTSKLLKLIQVAKTLGPTTFKEFLNAIFLFRPFQFEQLPVTGEVEPYVADYAIILANIRVKGAECRAHVARILLNTIKGHKLSYEQDSYSLAVFILDEHPSLDEIGSRLGSIQDSGERQTKGLLEAQEAIA